MKKPLPDLIQNGFQHSEVCLFDASSVEPLYEVQRSQIGGQNHSQKEPLIKKSMALNIMNFIRDRVLDDKLQKHYSEEEIKYYKNHDYIKEIDEKYNNQPINRKRPAYQKTRKNRK